jgi:hypothetical protein
MELTVALTALLRRYPRMALATPVEELPWRGSHLNRGLAALPLDTGEPASVTPGRKGWTDRRTEVATGARTGDGRVTGGAANLGLDGSP